MLLMKMSIYIIIVCYTEAGGFTPETVTINSDMGKTTYITKDEANYSMAVNICLKNTGHPFHVQSRNKFNNIKDHFDRRRYWVGYEMKPGPVWVYPEYHLSLKVSQSTNLFVNDDEKDHICLRSEFEITWEGPSDKCFILCEIETALSIYKVPEHPDIICSTYYCYDDLKVLTANTSSISCTDPYQLLTIESGAEYMFLKANIPNITNYEAINFTVCKIRVTSLEKYLVTTQETVTQETSHTPEIISTALSTDKLETFTSKSATRTETSTPLLPSTQDRKVCTSSKMTRKSQLNNVEVKQSVIMRSRLECAALALREGSTSLSYDEDSNTCNIYRYDNNSNDVQCDKMSCYSCL